MGVSRGAALLALTALLGCQAVRTPAPSRAPASVVVPRPVLVLGGAYIAWTEEAEYHWQSVLACVELPTTGRRPALWVAGGGLTLGDRELAGLYLPDAHAIIVSGRALTEAGEDWRGAFWGIVRHEAIHAAGGDPDHTKHFAASATCHFWPPLR